MVLIHEQSRLKYDIIVDDHQLELLCKCQEVEKIMFLEIE